MSLSIIFSVTIYNMTSNEVEVRLERFQTTIQRSRDITNPDMVPNTLLDDELSKSETNLSIELFYINLFILIAGGFASYYLARHHLLPIEKAHEAQSRFTSDASHELRTPLAVMKTEIEVALSDNNASVDDLKEILVSNLEEVDKLAKLAEMLLQLSRLDNTKIKLSPINLNKITQGILKDFNQPQSRILLTSKKQQIINGNEMAIADLIKILLDNALQYSPKNSQIKIGIRREDNKVIFDITNLGPGIQPDKLEHIFDRFYRADSSRTHGEQKGYGLGLALAKKIVELHDGELIASSAPNEETTFTFVLPLHSNSQAKSQN
jgi:signal transduction histidine kinase